MDFDTIRTRAATSVWDRPSASPSPETQSVNFSRIKRFVASFDLDEQEDSIRKELGIPPFTDYSHQQKVLQGCSVILYDCLQDKEHSKPGHPEFHGKPLLTLFAPTNIAFAAIPPKLKFYLFSSFGEHAQPGGVHSL
ncbi:hypothetical protein L486_02369 [Kwoniella mangroviensis CBS 10435]|uniref:Uncharacterized protein n=1 Tax=Kwoniella mangroviensis CBS 10435 TaxID=1331196 RepID=A0A1B9IVZ4_9TREE|nr:hypothetical protein L486_02369 [Kwoniella mangroviensis CBS 10435]